MMIDDLNDIQARIQDIQSRIAALNSPPTAAGGAAPSQDFQQALQRAAGSAEPPAGAAETAAPSDTPAGIHVPPASLGPLPPLPVAPDPNSLAPLTKAQAAGTGQFDGLVQSYAAKNGLPPALIHAVIQTESGGNPRAVSQAGAMGLMQLMPSNVKEAGISDPFDPEQNIAAGSKQLASLMAQYHGDLDLVLAGYNAGPGNVRKYGGVPPFVETQNYIRKVRAAMEKG